MKIWKLLMVKRIISDTQSNLKKFPLNYSGDSYCVHQRRIGDISKATDMMGRVLFSARGIPNHAYTNG